MNGDFYEDLKYCERCKEYRHYLQSPEGCFCVECGRKVRMFSRPDQAAFARSSKQELSSSRRGFNDGDWDDSRLVS